MLITSKVHANLIRSCVRSFKAIVCCAASSKLTEKDPSIQANANGLLCIDLSASPQGPSLADACAVPHVHSLSPTTHSCSGVFPFRPSCRNRQVQYIHGATEDDWSMEPRLLPHTHPTFICFSAELTNVILGGVFYPSCWDCAWWCTL
jgi:hypothetical protein